MITKTLIIRDDDSVREFAIRAHDDGVVEVVGRPSDPATLTEVLDEELFAYAEDATEVPDVVGDFVASLLNGDELQVL